VFVNFEVATSLTGSTRFWFSISLANEVNEKATIANAEKNNFFIVINFNAPLRT
jgi:hypothetical protein